MKPPAEPGDFTVTTTLTNTSGEWLISKLDVHHNVPLFDDLTQRDDLIDALCTVMRKAAEVVFTRDESRDIREHVVAGVRIHEDPMLWREAVDRMLDADPERAQQLRDVTTRWPGTRFDAY